MVSLFNLSHILEPTLEQYLMGNYNKQQLLANQIKFHHWQYGWHGLFKIQQCIVLSIYPSDQTHPNHMDKIQLIHNCLVFQHNKRKYVYGITYSQIMSNFLFKFKPDYIIVPSTSYVNTVFMHAAVTDLLANLTSKNNKESNTVLDKILKFAKLLVVDQKKLQDLYPSDIISSLLQKSQLSLFKQHDLDEKILIKLHLDLQISQVTPSYQNCEDLSTQLLDWMNSPSFQLKVIVPENGMTTYLCQGTDILVVDPTEQFVNYLKHNAIVKPKKQGSQTSENKEDYTMEPVPTLIHFLKTIIVTKMASITAILGLMLVDGVGKVSILVISQQLEKSIIQKSNTYLKYPEEVTRSRLHIKNIGSAGQAKPRRFPMIPKFNNPFSLQSPSTLNCSFYPLSQFSQPYLQFTFGSSVEIKTNKKIIFYCPTSVFSTETEPEAQLSNFPALLKDETVDLVVIYKTSEELMKELKGLPQALRKKIILNRNEHKYNHKYFITFEKNKIEHCLVTDTEYIQLMTFKKVMKSPVQSIENVLQSLKNKEVVIKNMSKNKNGTILTMKTIEPGAKVYEMGHCAEIETIGQVVQILDGIAKLWFQGTKKTAVVGGSSCKSQYFHSVQKIQALKFAQIKIISESDYEILMNFNNLQKSQNVPNKIVPTESTKSNLDDLQQISTISENSLIQCMSVMQQKKLNKICRPVTYEVGLKTNNYNENVYFISKGGMKWEDNDEIAGNGYFIGDLSSYYAMKEGSRNQFDNFIEVVKDTWALEINIEEFHQFFIMEYPHLLSSIYAKGKIFK